MKREKKKEIHLGMLHFLQTLNPRDGETRLYLLKTLLHELPARSPGKPKCDYHASLFPTGPTYFFGVPIRFSQWKPNHLPQVMLICKLFFFSKRGTALATAMGS
ncbi:uncharacterized protein TM35_000751040 [Trypanosoma theileri]|uniref:Uncharacterized protein n=1 Tax=Trypanosoma theileri TaxID=67003 RepID=A0A1X0NF98_9TRYP|nr:uncharacterized protein TM35_000751040 [Trypanosoma theileri]ORC83337.1 hypothetical protein TM35_000751040 [Trypanosoma theileri]